VYKIIKYFLNGIALGITETVPGFSGGTTAVILGFYDEFIKSVNHFKNDVKNSLKFLIPLVLGVIAGLMSFGSLVNYLLKYHSFPTMLFFVGLIAGVMPPIYFKLKKIRPKFVLKRFLLVLLSASALALLSGLKKVPFIDPAAAISEMGVPFMFLIFFSGIFAAAAFVVPAVSGSVVLIITGVYPLVIYSLSQINVFITDITNVDLLLEICKVFVPLGAGFIIGALSMLRLIEKFMKERYENVYSVIFGLLAGSIYVIINEPIVFGSYIEVSESADWNILSFFAGKAQISPLVVAIGIFTLFLGAAVSYFVGKKRI